MTILSEVIVFGLAVLVLLGCVGLGLDGLGVVPWLSVCVLGILGGVSVWLGPRWGVGCLGYVLMVVFLATVGVFLMGGPTVGLFVVVLGSGSL
ncbi:hypothetical protein U1Q18_023442 [Sarracenia purpurea var. burkii]